MLRKRLSQWHGFRTHGGPGVVHAMCMGELPREKAKLEDEAREKPVGGRLYSCSADTHPPVGGALSPCPAEAGWHVAWS